MTKETQRLSQGKQLQTLESTIIEMVAPEAIEWKTESLSLDSLDDTQILAKTLYSAISPGTEIAAWRGDKPLRPGNIYPRLMGYCNVAEVVERGKGVTDLYPGDLILTHQSHRSAFLCDQKAVISRIPQGMDPISASTAYLFHLGYSAILKGNALPGTTVGVLGLGTLGISTLLLADALGYPAVGFTSQVNAFQDIQSKGITILPKTPDFVPNDGYDLIINTSNQWADHRLAMQLARPGGTVIVMGFPGRTEPKPDFNPLDSRYFYDKQLTLAACGQVPNHDIPSKDLRYTLKRNCAFLLDLIHSGKLDARMLVTDVLPWQALESAYRNLEDRQPSTRTYVLNWTA